MVIDCLINHCLKLAYFAPAFHKRERNYLFADYVQDKFSKENVIFIVFKKRILETYLNGIIIITYYFIRQQLNRVSKTQFIFLFLEHEQ